MRGQTAFVVAVVVVLVCMHVVSNSADCRGTGHFI